MGLTVFKWLTPAAVSRRPWCVEDIGAAFVAKDSAGLKLAYVYFEEEPGRRSSGQAAHKGRGTAISTTR